LKAVVIEKYGSPNSVLKMEERKKPIPKDDQVLVKVYASSVNYADRAYVLGKPFIIHMSHGFTKPKYPIPGMDFAGHVEAVGKDVKQFQPGDEVYGDNGDKDLGAYAEYISVPTNILSLKPKNLTFQEAAAVPQAAVVALQGLRDVGQIQSGQKVLINGASGGIGTFAVQIAKSFGVEVTGVCSTKKIDKIRSIGADHVIDYTKEDFTQKDERYDLVIDVVANKSVLDYTRVLADNGKYVSVAINWSSLFLGPLISMIGNKKSGTIISCT